MNRMADVAALFGKKLNEEFTVKYDDYKVNAVFTEDGFYIPGSINVYDNVLLVRLLQGYAEIVEG